MKLNKVNIHVENKPSGKGRKINVLAKSAEKILYKGR
jgi:hypothetical protein